jgi:hypothetical protein
MERNSRIGMKVTMALAGAGMLAVSAMWGEQKPAITVDAATHALVYGNTGAGWTTRAAALAAANGEAARAIGHVAEAVNVDSAARDHALEALALAGTADAQAAMREALASPAAKNDAAYPILVARLANVETPTFDTLVYLAQLRETAKTDGQMELADAASPAAHRLRQARAPLAHKR